MPLSSTSISTSISTSSPNRLGRSTIAPTRHADSRSRVPARSLRLAALARLRAQIDGASEAELHARSPRLSARASERAPVVGKTRFAGELRVASDRLERLDDVLGFDRVDAIGEPVEAADAGP